MAEQKPSYARNLAYAALAGQAGCITLALVLVALLAGLWLDARFDQRGPFTMGLLILSVPICLFAMLRLAMAAIAKLPPPDGVVARDQESSKEG